MKPARFLLLLVFSPTRLLIEYLMRHSKESAAAAVLRWNIVWLCVEVAVALALIVATMLSGHNAVSPWLCGLLAVVAGYRVNEISWAFYGDASNRLSGVPPRTPLTPAQRIQQAMRSYASLTIDFAIIAFALPSRFYGDPFVSFIDALYFSGTTISTLGYGDFVPKHAFSKMLAVYEVFSGILLVVVALGVYLSGVGSNEKK